MTPVTPARTVGPGRPSQRRLWLVIAFVLVILVASNAFFHRPSTNELLAAHVTKALQANDLAAVDKYANAESRLIINHRIVGKAADDFAPLGAIVRVKETTPKDEPDPHVHTFHVTFEHGSVDERLQLDADGKIFRFHYDPPQPAK